MTAPVLEGGLLEGVIARLTRPDYGAFEAQLRSSGYCARPVRLTGRVEVCDAHGRRQQVWTTDTEPDGVLRKACGNRREAVCGPCAERYRGDARQLIAAGLRGGKGIPESVTGHPAIFATLTAPGFGPVHAHILDKDGRPRRCHPRRAAPICPHGTRISCAQTHGPDDPCLGEPLCPDCFDYEGAVVWNNLLGELWRRSTIYLPRRLARVTGLTQKRLHELVRVSYVKVAEYQHRGLVHLHVLMRLDKRMPAYRASEVQPPDRRFTTQLLEDALRETVKAVTVKVPDELGGGVVRWGKQLDVEQLTADDKQRRHRAGYLAKYSTKSTEQAGGLLHKINRGDLDHVNVSDHNRRYLRTAFDLHDQVTDAIAADEPEEPLTESRQVSAPAPATSRYPNELVLRVLQAMSTSERIAVRLHDGREFVGQITRRTPDGLALDTGLQVAMAEVCAITTAPLQTTRRDKRDRRLAACAHTYGHRGHCLTKSHHYSLRFKDLRQARTDHVHEQLLVRGDQSPRELAEHDAEQRITAFDFVGVGHLTTADAYLAAQAAARAREHRELAREALYDHHNRTLADRCDPPQGSPIAA